MTKSGFQSYFWENDCFHTYTFCSEAPLAMTTIPVDQLSSFSERFSTRFSGSFCEDFLWKWTIFSIFSRFSSPRGENGENAKSYRYITKAKIMKQIQGNDEDEDDATHIYYHILSGLGDFFIRAAEG